MSETREKTDALFCEKCFLGGAQGTPYPLYALCGASCVMKGAKFKVGCGQTDEGKRGGEALVCELSMHVCERLVVIKKSTGKTEGTILLGGVVVVVDTI